MLSAEMIPDLEWFEMAQFVNFAFDVPLMMQPVDFEPVILVSVKTAWTFCEMLMHGESTEVISQPLKQATEVPLIAMVGMYLDEKEHASNKAEPEMMLTAPAACESFCWILKPLNVMPPALMETVSPFPSERSKTSPSALKLTLFDIVKLSLYVPAGTIINEPSDALSTAAEIVVETLIAPSSFP